MSAGSIDHTLPGGLAINFATIDSVLSGRRKAVAAADAPAVTSVP